MRVAIVGAGLTGLACGRELAAAGHEVIVFERGSQVGGLASAIEVGGEPLERYYHHVFTHDTTFRDYARALGLEAELEWLPSSMGMFAHGRLFPFAGPLDLLRLPIISLPDRLRFGLATLWVRARSQKPPDEQETALPWLRRLFGEAGTRAIWEPMLRKKFEQHADQVAAIWMHGKIAARGGTRERGREREVLGYMRGGFQRFHQRLAESPGVAIRLEAEVAALVPEAGRWRVTTRAGESEDFDQVLVTTPPRAMQALVAERLNEDERQRLARLKFQGAIVALLALDRPLTPYYWINIHDHDVPFGGLIEHTNLVPAARYGGAHLVYLSRYISPTDPLFQASDEEVLARFIPELAKFNPAFQESWLTQRRVFRDAYTQPVVEPGYPARRPPLATSAPGLFLANMNHIYPEDRGMNYALALGRKAAAEMAKQAP